MSLPQITTMKGFSLVRQVSLRVLLALALSGLVVALSVTWLFQLSQHKTALREVDNAVRFYAGTIQDQERAWEEAALRYRGRIEFMRLLENPATRWERLSSYLTTQSAGEIFPNMLVTDSQDRVLFRFGFEENEAPALFAHKQENRGWYYQAQRKALFRYFIQPIWLGPEGMGHLILARPLDHAWLYHLATPETQLFVRWHARTVASSLGESGLNRRLENEGLAEAGGLLHGQGRFLWQKDDKDTPEVVVQHVVDALFTPQEVFAFAFLAMAAIFLALWAAAGLWLFRTTRRISLLGKAAQEFAKDHKHSPALDAYLRQACMTREDEVNVVARSLDDLATEVTQRNVERNVYEASLRASEAKVRRVTSVMGDGLYVLDQDGNVTFLNAEAERLLGWSEAELLGRNGHEMFHYMTPQGTPITRDDCVVHRAIRSGDNYRSRNDWLVRRDGSILPVSITASPILEDGKVMGSVAAFHDITERLEAEKALREKEARYRLLFNSGNDAILVHTMETQDGRAGRFVEVNDVACRMLGYSRDELLHMSPLDIDEPESASDMAEVMQEFLTHGAVLFERTHVTRSGEKIPVEINSHAFEMNGEAMVMSVVRNISERRQAMALQDRLQRDQRALLDASRETALLLERDGTILAVNQIGAKRLHSTTDELLSKNLFDLIPPELAKTRREDMARVIQNGMPTVIEDERQGMRLVNSIFPVVDADGKINRVAVYSADVTGQRLLEGIENLFSAINQQVLQGEAMANILEFICVQVALLFRLEMTWVGHKEPDGTVSIYASAGSARGYAQHLATTGVRWDESPLGQGPTGTAIRSGQIQVFNRNSPGFQTWASIAQEFGLEVILGIPLRVHGEIYGAFLLYSSDPDAFAEPAVVKHFSTIASRICMALEMLMDQQKIRLLSTALSSAANAVLVTDHQGNIQWTNAAFSRLSGYSAEEIIGKTPRILKSGQQDHAYYQSLWQTIGKGEVWSGETVEKHKSGSLFTVMQTVTPMMDESGGITHFIAVLEDISDKKRIEERMRHMAQYDTLTDLPNRALFYDRLRHAISLAKRSKLGLALLFLDLDRFKLVNDTLGHHVGDLLLKKVARRLRKCVRESDTVARLAGDEFTVLLYDLHDRENIGRIAEKIIVEISRPYQLEGHEVRIGVSIGIARYRNDSEDEDRLVNLADKAMYTAKAEGRNTYRFCVDAQSPE